jgi:hypothetical protein
VKRKAAVCMGHIGTVGRVSDLKVVVKFMTLFVARMGFCLLAESCELIAYLTLCKQKHPLKLSAIYQLRTAVLWCGKGNGREAGPKLGSRRQLLTGLSKSE